MTKNVTVKFANTSSEPYAILPFRKDTPDLYHNDERLYYRDGDRLIPLDSITSPSLNKFPVLTSTIDVNEKKTKLIQKIKDGTINGFILRESEAAFLYIAVPPNTSFTITYGNQGTSDNDANQGQSQGSGHNVNKFHSKSFPVLKSGKYAGYCMIPLIGSVGSKKKTFLVNPDEDLYPAINYEDEEGSVEANYIRNKKSFKKSPPEGSMLDPVFGPLSSPYDMVLFYYYGVQHNDCLVRYGWYEVPEEKWSPVEPVNLGVDEEAIGAKPPVYFRTRFLKANAKGYVRVSGTDQWPHSHLYRIGKVERDSILNWSHFPPKFNGDLTARVNGKHFYSPNDDCYYYKTDYPKQLIVCYYIAKMKFRVRKVRVNDCGYIVLKDTQTYKNEEIYMVGTYYPDPPNIALFIEHRMVHNNDIDRLKPPNPPVKEELDVKVGPLNINMVLSKMTSLLGGGENPLVPFLDGKYQVASETYAQNMVRYQAYLREMEQRYSKVQAVVPSCKKMFPGSQHSVYQPAAKYQGRAFYCPGNKTFYFYVKELTDILKKDKDGNDYVEVTYLAKPRESYVLLPDLLPDNE